VQGDTVRREGKESGEAPLNPNYDYTGKCHARHD